MKEYRLSVNFTVDAHDHDEAVEIAKAVRATIEANCHMCGHGYKLRDVETDRIEEF